MRWKILVLFSFLWVSCLCSSPTIRVYGKPHKIILTMLCISRSLFQWRKNKTQSSVISLCFGWFGFWPLIRSFKNRFPLHAEYRKKWTVHTPFASGQFSLEDFFFQLNLVLKPLLRVHASSFDLNSLPIWCSNSSIIKEELLLCMLLTHEPNSWVSWSYSEEHSASRGGLLVYVCVFFWGGQGFHVWGSHESVPEGCWKWSAKCVVSIKSHPVSREDIFLTIVIKYSLDSLGIKLSRKR